MVTEKEGGKPHKKQSMLLIYWPIELEALSVYNLKWTAGH